MEVGAKTVFVCNCHGGREAVIRIDPATTSVEAVRRRAAQMIVYGEGALWALTRSSRHDRTDRPRDERSHRDHSARTNRRDQWLALPHGNRRGAIWVLAPASLWKIDSHDQALRRKRSARAQRGQQHPDRCRSRLGRDLRGDRASCRPDSQAVPSRFRSGPSSTPPIRRTHSRSARERSGLRLRRSLRDDRLPGLDAASAAGERLR